MKDIKQFITKFIAILISAACVSTAVLAQEFTAYEGKGLREGAGGAKKIVDGIDIWSEGSPPFKFKIIGVINDRRHKTGLIGKMRMASLETDLAQLAKSNGGDGVILASAEVESTGVIGMAQAYGTSNSATTLGTGVAVQKQNSKYYVVKYFKAEETATKMGPSQPSNEPGAIAPSQGATTMEPNPSQ